MSVLLKKYMYNDITVIKKDPEAIVEPFNMVWFLTRSRPYRVLYRVA
jgi:hypothetical protein